MHCKSVVCESVERVHGVNPWLMRSMNRLCYDCWYLWKMQYVVGNLKQIDDILIPQIEEEIAEVSKSLGRVQQYPELFTSRKSKCFRHELVRNRPFDPDFCVVRVMCLSEHSSMHMHACFQLLSLTFMSTDSSS